MQVVVWIFSCLICISSSVIVIDLQNEAQSLKLPTQAAIGLYNLQHERGAFVQLRSRDAFWLKQTVPDTDVEFATAHSFLKSALNVYPVIAGDSSNLELVPSWVTLSAALGAIPMDHSIIASFPNTQILRNFSFANELDAAKAVSREVLHNTSGLSIQSAARLLNGDLVDFIFYNKLFVLFLKDVCVPLTRNHIAFKKIVSESKWPRPIRVFGYNNQDKVFGGDLFEAETSCVNTMGQIASAESNNFAFFGGNSQAYPDHSSVSFKQVPSPHIVYNSSKVYIAWIYGDLDNLDIAAEAGQKHMSYRLQKCVEDPNTCFHLTWTTSPNLAYLCKPMIQWFYDQASLTQGRDHFIFPPSGTLYSYPSLFPAAVQGKYVENMNKAARIMDTHGTIHWEIEGTWIHAFRKHFTRYNRPNNHMRLFFTNSVPWVFPIVRPFKEKTYEVIGENIDTSVIVFKNAFNWDSTDSSGGKKWTPQQLVNHINQFKIGSIQYIYIIVSTPIEDLFEAASLLPEFVELVSYEQLESLVRQKESTQ